MVRRRAHGFTLVELVIVLVLIGVIAGVLIMQLRPALQSYLAVGRRANLVNQADAALHRIVTDVHAAVPNSLRIVPAASAGVQCLELVPTKAGGRYRTGPALDAAQGDARPFDPQNPTQAFDVMTELQAERDDVFVVGNENGGDVYAGVNRALIDTVAPAPAAGGAVRVTLKNAAPFPSSYEAGRFLVVAKDQQVVGYACVQAGRGPDGSGTGILYRTVRSFDSNLACPLAGQPPVLATRVGDCAFVYNVNGGATQQSGYLQLRLGLADGGESATLTMGAHVENVP